MQNTRPKFSSPAILASALILCSAGAIIAQDGPPPPPPSPASAPPAPPRPEQTPAQRLERLNTLIPDLTEDQKKAILGLYTANADAIAALRADQSLSPEQRQAQIRKATEESAVKIGAVFTEPQAAQLKEAMKNRPAGGNGPGGPNGGPGGNGPGGQGGMSPSARILRRYTNTLPDLTEEQKTKIVAIAEAAQPRMTAVREDQTLNDEQREEQFKKIQDETAAQTVLVFTDAQRAKWQAMLDAQRRREMEDEFNLRPGETLEQKKVRVLKPYTDAVVDLTAAQQDAPFPIASGASDVYEEIQSDDSRTPEQKQSILRRVQKATDKKVAAVLSKAQFALWQKAQAAAPAPAPAPAPAAIAKPEPPK